MAKHPHPTSSRGREVARREAAKARDRQVRQDRQIIEAQAAARRGQNGQRPAGGGNR